LATGIVLGWIWGTAPLKERMKFLESVIETDSEQKMERILGLESALRLEKTKAQELESELKWKKAKVLALESDLERCREKMMWSSDQRGW